MTIQHREAWERVRAQGKSSFIRHYGIVRWALPTGAFVWLTLYLVVPVLISPERPNWGYIGSRPFFLSLLGAVCLWPVGGYVFGLIEWRRLERRFGRH